MLCLPWCIQPEGFDVGLVSLLVMLSVITWPRWCASGFSTRKLFPFLLWLIRSFWEILWDYVNMKSSSNLHLLVLISIGISCLNQLFLEYLPNGDFSHCVIPHLFVQFYQRRASLLPHLSIYQFIDTSMNSWNGMSYSMGYNPLWLLFISHPNCLRVEQWSSFLPFWHLFFGHFLKWNVQVHLVSYLPWN